MTVDEAIKVLRSSYSNDEEIIIAWWDKEAFPEVSQDNWDGSCDSVMDDMDWSHSHDDISGLLQQQSNSL